MEEWSWAQIFRRDAVGWQGQTCGPLPQFCPFCELYPLPSGTRTLVLPHPKGAVILGQEPRGLPRLLRGSHSCYKYEKGQGRRASVSLSVTWGLILPNLNPRPYNPSSKPQPR